MNIKNKLLILIVTLIFISLTTSCFVQNKTKIIQNNEKNCIVMSTSTSIKTSIIDNHDFMKEFQVSNAKIEKNGYIFDTEGLYIGKFKDNKLFYGKDEEYFSTEIKDAYLTIQTKSISKTAFIYSKACTRKQVALGVASIIKFMQNQSKGYKKEKNKK